MGFVWVAIGGAAGSCLRYWVSLILGPFTVGQGFPWGTFTANALGSLGLGLVFVLAEDRRERIRASVTELQESLDYLRLSVKYLVFDLEATRRENTCLKNLLDHKDEAN